MSGKGESTSTALRPYKRGRGGRPVPEASSSSSSAASTSNAPNYHLAHLAGHNEEEENSYLQRLQNQEIRVTVDPAQQCELRRQYSDLIEACHTYREKEGFQKDLTEQMAQNIESGFRLFKTIKDTSSGSQHQPHTKVMWGPGDMYMAFLHTKIASSMLLSKAEKIGNQMSGFSIDGFVKALVERGSETGESSSYSPKELVRYCIRKFSRIYRHLPQLVSLMGSFDKSSLSSPPQIKEKKPRASRKKLVEEPGLETQHKEVQRLSEEQRRKKEEEGPEAQSQEMLRILKSEYELHSRPQNLVEFILDPKSFPTFVENCFYVSFLARDGYIGLKRSRPHGSRSNLGPTKSFDTSLVLKPESPPKNKVNESDGSTTGSRNQHIISFNKKTFEALAKACRGSAKLNRMKKESKHKKKKHEKK